MKNKVMLMIIIIVLIIAIVGVVVVFANMQQEDRRMVVGDREITVEIADNPAEQYQGLSGRESLCADCGMLFVYTDSKQRNFSMRGMRFALDFLFIDDGRVVEIKRNIQPPDQGASPEKVPSSVSADMVLEVNAGFVAKNQIEVGDKANFSN